MKNLFILFLFTTPLISFGQWSQLGNDVDGIEAMESTGVSVSLNANGDVMAFGAHRNDTNGSSSGQARIFEFNGTDWAQKGDSITGNSAGDSLGISISISADGNVVAVGAPAFVTSPVIAGYVKIFEWDGNSWNQRGMDIVGDNPDDTFGSSVKLSDDGSILAIGSPAQPAMGYARIFQWNGSSYAQLGNDIEGQQANGGFGRDISLNANGTIVAITTPNYSQSIDDSGIISVYEWNNISWDQLGENIEGEEFDNFGTSVDLNASGTIVSGGAMESPATGFTGHARVHEWNGTNWIQKGNKINGDNGSDFFADSAQLNDAGDILVCGSSTNYARVLKFDGTDWVQQGDDIIGEEESDQFGQAVAINGDGSRIIGGAQGNDAGGAQSGHVRVFENPLLNIDDNTQTNFSLYPNPTSNSITINASETIQSITIYSVLGKQVFSKKENKSTTEINLTNLSSGVYLVKIETQLTNQIIRVIKS